MTRESLRGARLIPCVIVVRSRGVRDFGDLVIGPGNVIGRGEA